MSIALYANSEVGGVLVESWSVFMWHSKHAEASNTIGAVSNCSIMMYRAAHDVTPQAYRGDRLSPLGTSTWAEQRWLLPASRSVGNHGQILVSGRMLNLLIMALLETYVFFPNNIWVIPSTSPS